MGAIGPLTLLLDFLLVEKAHELFVRVAATERGVTPYRYPSTGMLGLLLALNLCDEVSAFGFSAADSSRFHFHQFDGKQDWHAGEAQEGELWSPERDWNDRKHSWI